MSLYHIVILALIQGITEFLPVSSSGHLVLAHAVMGDNGGWEENLTLDVAVHVGTLFSVLLYFRKDLKNMFSGLWQLTAKKEKSDGLKLLLLILVGSVPVILAGLALHFLKPEWLRSVEVIGWTTLLFGLLLWAADKLKPSEKTFEQLTYKDVALIGLAQALALIPGTSRSGITMTAARWLGFKRTDAARFSLLLAMAAISGAGTLQGIGLIKSGDLMLGLDALIAAAMAFIAGWVSIDLMMKWLAKATFTPFVIYRIVLGVLLLGLIYSGII